MAASNQTVETRQGFRQKHKVKMHPFMPAPMHKMHIIRWLKRFHAWFGVWGAFAGIIFAWSGFVLNHRTDFRIGGENLESEYTIPAPEKRDFADGDEFGQYVREQLDLFGAPRGPAMGSTAGIAVPGSPTIESPSSFYARFVAASNAVTASYEPGKSDIQIIEQDRPPIRTLNRMHLGQAPNIGWQVVMDAYSGALIFLALSGILIWSRLSGPRLLGAGLIGFSFISLIYWIMLGP